MGAVPRGFSNHTMDKAKSGGKGWHGGGSSAVDPQKKEIWMRRERQLFAIFFLRGLIIRKLAGGQRDQ